jgi:hypothetical protein
MDHGILVCMHVLRHIRSGSQYEQEKPSRSVTASLFDCRPSYRRKQMAVVVDQSLSPALGNETWRKDEQISCHAGTWHYSSMTYAVHSGRTFALIELDSIDAYGTREKKMTRQHCMKCASLWA